MPNLTVDLREGFHHTETVIKVDGAEVYRNGDLSTRLQVGLAAQVRVTVPTEDVELEIELSGGAQREVRTLSLAQGAFVGVEVGESGAIVIRQSQEPMGYV